MDGLVEGAKQAFEQAKDFLHEQNGPTGFAEKPPKKVPPGTPERSQYSFAREARENQ